MDVFQNRVDKIGIYKAKHNVGTREACKALKVGVSAFYFAQAKLKKQSKIRKPVMLAIPIQDNDPEIIIVKCKASDLSKVIGGFS